MIVSCRYDPGSSRGRHLAHAMAEGIRAAGDTAVLTSDFKPAGLCDVIVAYGWGSPELFSWARANDMDYVYLDLGWWSRKPKGRELDGYHKVMVNCREPADLADYLGEAKITSDRFAAQGVKLRPWREPRDDAYLIVAGMSAKSAGTFDLAPEQWERTTIEALRHVRGPSRLIYYRPKPSWIGWTPLAGTVTSRPTESLDALLADAWALVTHHSNTAVDALCAGVPIHAQLGVASTFSTPLARLWDPLQPEGRDLLMQRIAWCQWNVDEMRSGACWRFLRDSGLIT